MVSSACFLEPELLLLRPTPPPPRRPKGPELPPPLYEGSVRLLDWKYTARGGMSVDLGIRDGSPTEVHPFKGLACGKEHGQRLRLWIGPHLDGLDEDARASLVPNYLGEGILLRWADDSVSGMMIRAMIDAGPDGTDGRHPFEGFATGKKEGDLFHMAAWAVADDETLQHPARTRRKTPFHELSETAQANILCRDARFISFLVRVAPKLSGGPCPIDPAEDAVGFAAWTVRKHLGIESRAELSHETAAAGRARRAWHDLMRWYFESEEWRSR